MPLGAARPVPSVPSVPGVPPGAARCRPVPPGAARCRPMPPGAEHDGKSYSQTQRNLNLDYPNKP